MRGDRARFAAGVHSHRGPSDILAGIARRRVVVARRRGVAQSLPGVGVLKIGGKKVMSIALKCAAENGPARRIMASSASLRRCGRQGHVAGWIGRCA